MKARTQDPRELQRRRRHLFAPGLLAAQIFSTLFLSKEGRLQVRPFEFNINPAAFREHRIRQRRKKVGNHFAFWMERNDRQQDGSWAWVRI